MAIGQKGAEFLMMSRLRDAEAGDVNALFELGVTYSTGNGTATVVSTAAGFPTVEGGASHVGCAALVCCGHEAQAVNGS